MDTSAVSGSALLMKAAQTQESISISIIKQAAKQQDQMATLLAQESARMPQPAPSGTNSTFSIYA